MRNGTRTLAALVTCVALADAASSAMAADTARGKAIYELWCADCHAATPGRFNIPSAGFVVLQKRYGTAKPAELTQRDDLSAAYVRTVVRTGLNVMPRTRKTEISDAELADLVAFLARSNP
jgi:mono/diheme cytochrome c family protein